ncbi:hypothetical protein EOD41_06790 [Mucilaginibacter limnophilus]|uniref:Uncharacterized protein n=1 Tax=Mucilaginibacter limnophilus TaxID=1932778 RepID=A0A437MVH6_9SPHI|nr:hypothetical protein [Mucilaginibacter limnophilus]RVU01661.1 hypothetical protein EOD41_06790 [Mucilaginibacter limnophilus]
MQTLKQYINWYKLFIIAYLFYVFWFYKSISKELEYRSNLIGMPEGKIVTQGEGLIYSMFFNYILGFGTVITCLLIAIIYKETRWQYIFMSFLLTIPPAAYVFITGF